MPHVENPEQGGRVDVEELGVRLKRLFAGCVVKATEYGEAADVDSPVAWHIDFDTSECDEYIENGTGCETRMAEIVSAPPKTAPTVPPSKDFEFDATSLPEKRLKVETPAVLGCKLDVVPHVGAIPGKRLESNDVDPGSRHQACEAV